MIAQDRLPAELEVRLCAVLYGSVEEQARAKQGFRIDSLKSADWALTKITRARAKMAENAAYAKEQLAGISAWLTKENADHEETLAFFEKLLADYAARELEGSKKQSLKLPKGTLGFRSQQPEYKRQEDILFEWLESNCPRLLKRTVVTDWAAVKSAGMEWQGHLVLLEAVAVLTDDCQVTDDGRIISPDGEAIGRVIPGVQVEPRPPSSYTKTDVVE